MREVTKKISVKGQSYEVTVNVDTDKSIDITEIIWLKDIPNQPTPLGEDVTDCLINFNPIIREFETALYEVLDGEDFNGSQEDYNETYHER